MIPCNMGQSVPLTLATVHKLISLQQNDFINYVVCPSCDSIYEYQDCLQVGANGQQISKECSHVDFPNHPQASRRKPCGTKLLKQVRTKRGSVLTPIKVYPYKPLKKSIEQLVKRENFVEKCEQWRSRKVPDGFVCDIYDGEVWRRSRPLSPEWPAAAPVLVVSETCAWVSEVEARR